MAREAEHRIGDLGNRHVRMSGINRDEWLAALKQAEPQDDPDVFTTDELAAMVGVKGTAMRNRIRRLLREEKVVRASKRIMDSSGRIQSVNAYKLVRLTPKARKA